MDTELDIRRESLATKAGAALADAIAAEDPAPTATFRRKELLKRAGLQPDEDSRVQMRFFHELNEQLMTVCGRMMANVSAGVVRFTSAEEGSNPRVRSRDVSHRLQLGRARLGTARPGKARHGKASRVGFGPSGTLLGAA